MRQVMLTTIDNPYDPFTQFDEWYYYDQVIAHYYTCQYLARVAQYSDSFTEEENNVQKEIAIDQIIKYDPLNIYKKVVKVSNQ